MVLHKTAVSQNGGEFMGVALKNLSLEHLVGLLQMPDQNSHTSLHIMFNFEQMAPIDDNSISGQ
jgi:hypothetical protein